MRRAVYHAISVLALCMATAVALSAQTFTTLFSFDGTDGLEPYAALVQGVDGDLYGTTIYGGAHNFGTVFKITRGGALTTLHSFCAQSGCTDGQEPGGLVLAPNGDFYGTAGGGAYRSGTLFNITPNGKFTTLYSFCAHGGPYCPDGSGPNGLVTAPNGDLYGTTSSGGTPSSDNRCYGGCGTVFKLAAGGTLTTLYRFCVQAGCPDGAEPNGLAQSPDGDFYGATYGGGAGGSGAIFKISPGGKLDTLYSFCTQAGCPDGYNPAAGLVQALDGDFYGTTYRGGSNGYGTIFKVSQSGALTTLHNFCEQSGCADGAAPYARLMPATDGNLYGTTLSGGDGNGGTVFEITPGGALTTLHSFCAQSACVPGPNVQGSLIQATSGDIYGTTLFGGPVHEVCQHLGCGTFFRLAGGLTSFVKTLPHSSRVGTTIRILGTNLSGAYGVLFNGAPAEFTPISDTEISTVVPVGATTGKIKIVTPAGVIFSGGPFFIDP